MSQFKDVLVFLVGLLSFIYLLNPTCGVFELIPDNLPLVGNLDEAGATMLLLYAFRYFGYDIINVLNNLNTRNDFRRRSNR